MKTTSLIQLPLRTGLLFLLAMLTITPLTRLRAASGSPPELMTYQGFLSDANGNALATDRPRNYDVIFRIYDASSGGNRVWTEKQTVTVDKGYFSVLLGQGASVGNEANTTSFSGVFGGSSASDRFLGLTVVGQGSGGSDLLIEPRLRMLPGPYAFLAKNANALANTSGSQVVTVSGNTVSLANSGSALNVTGTVSATSFSGNGSSLTSLGAANVSGTLGTSAIPSLDASKITTGTFGTALIPSLDSSKITSGTLSDTRLSANVALLTGNQTFSGSKGFSSGINVSGTFSMNNNSALNMTAGSAINLYNTPVRLRGQGDASHQLVHSSYFANSTYGSFSIDGPVLHGYAGGLLGYNYSGGVTSLRWSDLGVELWGRDASSPDLATAVGLAQHLTIRSKEFANDAGVKGNRLTLGMYHCNNLEYAGVIQAYAGQEFTQNPTTLRLNPRGGTVYATITSPSDRNVKTGFKAVDGKSVLEKLTAIPITTWAFTNAMGTTHMGPMAQDFHAAYGLGDDSKGIATLDAQGVAFAAIQGLNSVVKEKDEEIQTLKREVQELRALVEGLARQNAANRQ